MTFPRKPELSKVTRDEGSEILLEASKKIGSRVESAEIIFRLAKNADKLKQSLRIKA